MIHYYKTNCIDENLRLIREFVKCVLHEFNFNDIQINQLVLAVEEVCTNVIRHSIPQKGNDSLEINITDHHNFLEFEIIDNHLPTSFDPGSYKTTTINHIVKERKKGGIGLMLVKIIMDEVEYMHTNAQNIWRLRKSFPNMEPPSPAN